MIPTPALVATLVGSQSIDADGDGQVSPGDTLSYEMVVTNIGGATASDVGVTVDLPALATVVGGSVTTSQGTDQSTGDMVLVSLGSLDGGAVATVTFDVLLDETFATTTFSLQGMVTSAEFAPVLTDDPGIETEADGTTIAVAVAGGGTGGGGNGLPAPQVGALDLVDGAIITEPIAVSATLTPPDGETVVSWSVAYRSIEGGTLVELATGTDPSIATTVDPTVLPNGLYLLVVTAESSGGGISVTETSFVVDGQLKLGRYVTTFQDLAVGVAGFPIQVNRTYDSFDKTVGDFGVGWSLDIADFRVATNGPLGDAGWLVESCGGGLIFATLCFISERPHFVTVTWPDGLNEIFDLTPAEGSTFFTGLTGAEFTGRANTTSTFEAVDTSLFWVNGDLLGGAFGSGGIYDPDQFRLTDRFGTEYLIEVGVGLLEMRDRVGNTVTISPNGVTSWFGPGIDIRA